MFYGINNKIDRKEKQMTLRQRAYLDQPKSIKASADKVLKFLKKQKHKWATLGTIGNKLKLSQVTIGLAVARLQKKGVHIHRGIRPDSHGFEAVWLEKE